MNAITASHTAGPATGTDEWRAKLSLRFVPGSRHTRLEREPGFGPLYVQKPFYPEGDLCHVYLLHPPGGVAGGDRLDVQVRCASDSAALLTTPAANKFYRSNGRPATLTQTIRVEAGASCEWLPQETLLFGGAVAEIDTRFELGPGARLIAWDCLCLGREASGDRFSTGAVTTHLRIGNDNATPHFAETLQLEAGSRLLSEPWGLDGRRVVATLCATPADEDVLAAFRATRPPNTAGSASILEASTLVDNLLVHRVLGHGSEAVRQALVASWSALRPMAIGRSACAPRIWNT
ncbi:MAG: urease accessory protein UreD [Pseudomonadota bacterium]